MHAMMTPSSAPSDAPRIPIRVGPVEVWTGATGGKYPDGNYLLVRGADSVASFDLPTVSRSLPAVVRQADLVILSHFHEDHTAGLDLLPDRPVHVHAGDVAAVRSMEGMAAHFGYAPATQARFLPHVIEDFHYRPRPDALAYEDGAVWDLGGVRVRAIHAPGHTRGHCVLMVEPAGIAFIADIDLSGFGPYYGDATSSLADFRRTLAMLPDIEAHCWITSHHKGIVRERGAFLDALGKFGAALERREAALLAVLREQDCTLEDLVARRFVYPPGFAADFVEDVERNTIGRHLDEMLAQGRVRRDDATGRYRAS